MLVGLCRRVGLGVLLLLLAAGESVAHDDYSFSVVSVGSNQPNFGVVGASKNGTTVYRISPDGDVDVQQGSGGAASGATTGATVTVRCSGSDCHDAQAMLKIAKISTVTGRAQAVSNFTVQSNDLSIDWIATQGDGSLQVRLSGFSNGSNERVYVGMDLPIVGDNASTATTATARWTVGVAKWSNVPSLPGTNGTAIATVRKSISASTTSMSFGAMLKPDDGGSGTLTINASTGARTTAGSDPPIPVNGMTAQRGTVVVTGQANTSFTISLPSVFSLSNGSTTLLASPTRTATGTLTLSSGGTYTLGVGGTILVSSSATTGLYNGVITATVAYN